MLVETKINDFNFYIPDALFKNHILSQGDIKRAVGIIKHSRRITTPELALSGSDVSLIEHITTDIDLLGSLRAIRVVAPALKILTGTQTITITNSDELHISIAYLYTVKKLITSLFRYEYVIHHFADGQGMLFNEVPCPGALIGLPAKNYTW